MSEDAHELVCSACGGQRDRPGQRYCRACHNAYEQKRQRMERESLKRLRKIINGVPIGTFDDNLADGAEKR